MFYNYDELREIFRSNKRIIDSAYESTKEKYDDNQATTAMYEYFMNFTSKYFTRSNNARHNMEVFNYHSYELEQFLLEYAMRSYVLNNIECPYSLDEIREYANDKKYRFNYDKKSIISVVAVGSAWSPYWMVNLLSINKKVKEVLITSLIKERYIDNLKDALDNAKSTKAIRLKDSKRALILSIDTLNRNIDNMINDAGYIYFKDDQNGYNQNFTR